MICLFLLMNYFCYLAWNWRKKIFLGSHPGINFGAIYYPSIPFMILVSISIFLYIAYFQFVTILKRSFYHWDGFKNISRKNSKNRICQHWRVWRCWRTLHYHPIIPSSTSSHLPDSLDTTPTLTPAYQNQSTTTPTIIISPISLYPLRL